MIIKMKKGANLEDISKLLSHLKEKGFAIHESIGENYKIYGVIGDTAKFDLESLYAFTCVDEVVRITEPFKKVNRLMKPEDTVITLKDVKIGGKEVVIMAGPCSVESLEQTRTIAKSVKAAGAKILRGGAFKPRSSPYAFQGLGYDGLKILRQVADEEGLLVISELMDKDDIDEFVKYVDIIQIGARNMQNFSLLKALGKIKKPVMLKRGFSNTIDEWLMSAEYIMAGGNDQVILCERGIRTFEPRTRNTLEIATIPIVKQVSHLPIVIDPSHAAGRRDLVDSLAVASVAAGADGLIIEVHHDPEHAWSDGAQSLRPAQFDTLMKKMRKIAAAIGREL